jgi:pimeloyl-ACP methyl ester carboxylesterase
MCILFAATYPERTAALMTFGSFARPLAAPDYPWGRSEEAHRRFLEAIRAGWGSQPVGIEDRAPSQAGNERFRQWWTRYLVRSASPSAVLTLVRMNAQIDVRGALPAIRVPTLIMHRSGDRALDVDSSRYMAQQIARARFIEYPARITCPGPATLIRCWATSSSSSPARHAPDIDRVLATVMFADIVDSTQRAAAIGDRA